MELSRHNALQIVREINSVLPQKINLMNKHGIIKKIAKTYKYYLTSIGKAVIAAGLIVKEMSIIPVLAKA